MEEDMSYLDSDDYDRIETDDERFLHWALRTKKEVLEKIDWLIKQKKEMAKDDSINSSAYYHRYLSFLKEFRDEVEDTEFIENLDLWWTYIIALYDSGIELTLEHFEDWIDSDDFEVTGPINAEYKVLIKTADMLTVDEFASIHNLEAGTIRQWIRRGKLRTAKKYGRDWRIPLFAQLPTRGYKPATYYFKDKLTDIPSGFDYLNEYTSLIIEQNKENKQLFDISLYGKKKMKTTINEEERAKLELYLIGNDFVSYSGSCKGYWPR